MIVQNVSADGADHRPHLHGAGADYERARDTITEAKAAIGYAAARQGATDVAKVSVIGIGMRSHAGVAAKAFKALAARHQHPRHHHLRDQVLGADRRRLYRARGAHAAPGGPRVLLRRLRDHGGAGQRAGTPGQDRGADRRQHGGRGLLVYVLRVDNTLELYATEGLNRDAVHQTVLRAMRAWSAWSRARRRRST
jgi:hypothetical protein